jgi:heavy metal translocating P-type ATPase
VKEGDQIVEKKIAEIKVGDLILVELGERLPVDGVVVSGAGTLDQSALTGESLPVEKKEGDLVLSATLLIAGNLIVQAKRVGKDTSLERTIALVAQSQQNKAPISRLADKFAAAYILLVGIGAILLWLLTQDTRLVLAVLLVVCADDIAVAIPLAFLSATSYAARRGVIIKGGNFLEGLNQLKTVVLDKTGTLTLGRLVVERAVLSVGVSENELLTAGALTCAMSSHPTAKAVIKYAKQFGIEPVIPERYEERLGRGMIVDYRGERYAAGRPVFLADLNLLADEAAVTAITAAENQGFSVTIVSRGENLLGYFILADEVKPGLRPIMQDLHSLGVGRIVMLTGDNERVAARVAAGAGIDTYHAGLLPEQKVDYVKKYLNKESKVAMVGDGVNDAAALALADIGVAMGEIGSDQAIESADLVLAKDDLHKLPEMIRLSRLLMRVVKQDFVIWGVSNAVGLTLVFMRILPPEGAAAFNFLTDFFPLINSLRLFRLHLGRRGL